MIPKLACNGRVIFHNSSTEKLMERNLEENEKSDAIDIESMVTQTD